MSTAADEVEAIRQGLADGSVSPEIAMQRLVAIMRKDQNTPGAKDLYQEASQLAYGGGESSLSHSHPPPPSEPSGNRD